MYIQKQLYVVQPLSLFLYLSTFIEYIKAGYMYKQGPKGLMKHWDFLLLDIIILQVAFVIAYICTEHGLYPYRDNPYLHMALILIAFDISSCSATQALKDVLKRGYYKEAKATVSNAIMLFASVIIYFYLIHSINTYARSFLTLMFILYIVLAYLSRLLYKRILLSSKILSMSHYLMIATTSDMAEMLLNAVYRDGIDEYRDAGLAIIDKDMVGEAISGHKVSDTIDTAPVSVCEKRVDEILVAVPEGAPYPDELIEQFRETGVTIHQYMARINNDAYSRQMVEKFCGYTVLTTSINVMPYRSRVAKRCMDIAGGIVGTLITGILCIIIGPLIYAASPGPIFFCQERVGENGRRFKMIKFRSMYPDAEARKLELMKDNKLNSDRMFKLDFDPRVIGNRILPDGTVKTGIGEFIRRTSLDEFPQFINVLKGDMSIVGTRPPLPSETAAYELRHHSRLSVKPGITGLWQISGRSDITDFEEVVRLDREYIMNRDLGMDIKIILKTIAVVFKGKGAV